MFDEIISLKNLEQAYLKLADQMEEDGRSGRYAGWDGIKLSDLEVNSARTVQVARQELAAFSDLPPAVLFNIPKKSNPQKNREIYIYNLKERVKAQAIYQIIEPYFDRYFSPWLFSYRSSHPSYFAARSVVRHYRKYYQRDYALIVDLSDYSNYIQPDILIEKIKALDFEDEVNKLLNLFIANRVVRDGQIVRPDFGLIQGVPLIALFNNLYLDESDKYCGPRADFYRRVGDDLIIFDQKKDRLAVLYEYIKIETNRLGLKINNQKTKLIKADQKFNFLGYSFFNGQIGLEKSFYNNLIKRWRTQFDFYRFKAERRKKDFLHHALSRDNNNLSDQFRQIAIQKKLVTDDRQVRELSEAFFRILTRYFFGVYSAKNRRLLVSKLKALRFASLYKYFSSIKHGYGKRAD